MGIGTFTLLLHFQNWYAYLQLKFTIDPIFKSTGYNICCGRGSDEKAIHNTIKSHLSRPIISENEA